MAPRTARLGLAALCALARPAPAPALQLGEERAGGEPFSWMKKPEVDELPGAPSQTLVRWGRDLLLHYDWPSVAKQVCMVMARRGNLDYNKYWMLREGHIDMAIWMLKKWPNDKSVQVACAKAVGGMATLEPGIEEAAGKQGAVELVVDIMKKWPDDPEAQVAGASGSLMDYNEENRERWAKAGGIELVMAAARRHYKDDKVIREVARALAVGARRPNGQRFVDAGGMRLLIQLMRDHAQNHRVREYLMTGTRTIVREDNLTEKIAEAGYLPALIAAMKEAGSDKYQLTAACDNIKVLVNGSSTRLEEAVQGGVTLAAWRAVKAAKDMPHESSHAEYEEEWHTVREDCMELLAALAPHPKARQELYEAMAATAIDGLEEGELKNKRVKDSGDDLRRLLR